MARLVANFLPFSLLVILLAQIAINGAEEPAISCAQTPHPQLCSSEISSEESISSSHFRNTVLRKTMHRAVKTRHRALSIALSGLEPRAKAAWDDCTALCEETIRLLRSCTISSSSSSYDDAQTWLSAAMANQQTCINGFVDFGCRFPRQYYSVYASNNLTEWISNSLAVNKAMTPPGEPSSGGGGGSRRLLSDRFPEWLSAGDRRLLQQSSGSAAAVANANIVVAKDGSGDYTTISAAVAAAGSRQNGTSRFVIYVKAGVYQENVVIGRSMKNLMVVGDGIGATVVTGSENVQDGFTTFQSATFAINGDGFIAQDITFQNTAGPQKHQAVALRSGSDLSVFYQCSFEGYQDTLYVYSQRQFYRDCDVYGTVDFIFGDAAVVFQSCNMYVRRPMSGQENTVTAQGRTDPNENTGISIQDSTVAAASDLQPVQSSFRTYLGRPWKKYSRTVFMESSLGGLIDPAGWLEWSGNFALSTLYYGEYMNTGAGANTSGRVKWPGYQIITSAAVASQFTVGNFLSGNSWLPATGVPFTSGL